MPAWQQTGLKKFMLISYLNILEKMKAFLIYGENQGIYNHLPLVHVWRFKSK